MAAYGTSLLVSSILGVWVVLATVSASEAGPPAFSVETKLSASDFGNSDLFGSDVGIDGDTAAVGARQNDTGGAGNEGAVYVFQRNQGGPGAWGEVKKLVGSSSRLMGRSLDVGGDTVLAGADEEAYVFDRDQGGIDAWGEVAVLAASDAAPDDDFGTAVAIDGDTVVVGADDDDDSGFSTGAAYVYERDAGGADAWGEVKKLLASDAAAGDLYGSAVAISGDTIAVVGNGSVYVHERDLGGADQWGEAMKTPDVGASGVALDGDVLVVGAVTDDEAAEDAGAVFVHGRDVGGAGNWGLVVKIFAPDPRAGDRFGVVDLDGDRMVVGAPFADLVALQSGAAYVFDRNEGGPDGWGHVATVTASDGAEQDFFGPVALSDAGVIVGAQGHDHDGVSGSGAAYLFETPVVPMFVTASDYPADFGGLAGGDAICEAEADGAGLAGIWKALLSVQGTDRFDRLPDEVAIETLDGRALADDSVALAGGLENPLDVEPGGATAPASSHVWTGDSDADGNCLDFTATAGDVGQYGLTSAVTTDWYGAGTDACSEANRLYCHRSYCPSSIAAGCLDSWEKGGLLVSETKLGKEKLVVKLLRGPALAQADFGDPASDGGTGYEICLYDGSGELVTALEVDRAGADCAGKPCWKPLGGAPGGKGWVYKDKTRSAGGIQKILMKGGPIGKPKIQIKAGNNSAKGQNGQPRRIAAALSGSTSATVQIHASDPTTCFSITFDDVKKDLGFFFQARK